MIVVEDVDASEIRLFVVVDASISLGLVQAGTSLRTFDSIRVLRYFQMVDERIADLSVQYPESFKYRPRRTYGYLKKPSILSELYQNILDSGDSWLVDYFFAHPLISIGNNPLPENQQTKNSRLVHRWTIMPPHSPRFYYIQDMRLGQTEDPGWACILRPADLIDSLQDSIREQLFQYINAGLPVFIEKVTPDDLDELARWFIILKESGIPAPNAIISVESHREWGSEITRLLEIPNSRITTAGATISSLSTIVGYLKKRWGKDWSSKILFASNYPETQSGDSIAEILSFLLSRSMDGSVQDIQKILGGNILALLPPRPPFLNYVENDTSVVAEGRLGETALAEFTNILQVLAARNTQGVVSIDNMVSEDGGTVDTNSYVLTIKGPNNEQATSLALLVGRDGTLRISGWRRSFSDSLTSRDLAIHNTLVGASTRSGPVLTSPSHLSRFVEALLRCLKVKSPTEILSSLHFRVVYGEGKRGVFQLCPDDMRAIGLSAGNLVTAIEPSTGNWGVGRIAMHPFCQPKRLIISREDADLIGLRNPTAVNLVKTDGKIVELEETVFAFSSLGNQPNLETAAFVSLNNDEIKSRLKGQLLGKGARVFFGKDEDRVVFSLVSSKPKLDPGQIARMGSENIRIRSQQTFRNLNIIIAIILNDEMKGKDVGNKTPLSLSRKLEELAERVPDVQSFLKEMDDAPTRAEIAGAIALLLLDRFSLNKSDGRIGLVTVTDTSSKFTLQKGNTVQNYVRFEDDLQSDEVLTAMVYSIIDGVRDVGGSGSVNDAFRPIAELLEDFGQEQPTLVIVLAGYLDEPDEGSQPFLDSIKSYDRYQMDIFSLGSDTIPKRSLALVKDLRARIVPVKEFSSTIFDEYAMSVIDDLTSRKTDNEEHEGSQ